jgi:pentapeptide MXKDX repeat protein
MPQDARDNGIANPPRARLVLRQDFFNAAGNNRDPGIVLPTGHVSLQRTAIKTEVPSMTIGTRIALCTLAVAVSLSLALAPVASAQDGMKQDLDFKSGVSRDDETRKDNTISRVTISKGATSRYSLKKDEGAKKGRISR